MKTSDFQKGAWVFYVPSHVDRSFPGYLTDPAVERGIITSYNEINVFVNFGNTGTSPACDPSDLVLFAGQDLGAKP